MKKLILTALAATALSGCVAKSVNVTPSPISGSKADGTVTMGYVHHSSSTSPTTAVVDWDTADEMATKKCDVWGYSSAERFGTFQNETCTNFANNVWTGQVECVTKTITMTYQCID